MPEDILGFCTKCIRVRWLARVTHRDSAGNPQGFCRSCEREIAAMEADALNRSEGVRRVRGHGVNE